MTPVKAQLPAFKSGNRNVSAQTAHGLRKLKLLNDKDVLQVDGVDPTSRTSFTHARIMQGFTEDTRSALHLLNQFEMKVIEKSGPY